MLRSTLGDTLLKGTAYLGRLGPVYGLRRIVPLIGDGFGAAIPSPRFQSVLVAVAVIGQLGFFFAYYERLG